MSKSMRKQTERYYVAYQRSALVGLLFGVVAAALFLATLMGLMSPDLARVTALIIITLFIVTLLSVHLVTLRGRLWHPRAPEARRVLGDEWTRKNWNRACRSGFFVVMWAQVPLAYFVTALPPKPDVPAMAALTMALGVAAFFGSYLYHSRHQGDG